MRVLGLFAALLIAVAGCNGLITDPGVGPGPGGPGPGPGPNGLCAEIGDQPLLRISSVQWENTVRDIFPGGLGDALVEMNTFPETVIDSGFTNDALANTVNTAESNGIEDNAELISEFLLADAATYLPQTMSCVDAGYSDPDIDACVDTFIEELGLRVNRRPITEGERTVTRALYDEIRTLQGAEEAWSVVVQLYLQSPALLYRTERGSGYVDGTPDLSILSHYEMASRLSYFFTNSMPDDELFAAAAAEQLGSRAEIEMQARRLLDDPRSMEAVTTFHIEWLKTYELAELDKDTDVYPMWNGTIQTALVEETERIVTHVLDTGDGSYVSLLVSGSYPVAADLGGLYGVSGADGGVQDLADRHGLLTSASFAATHAREASTNPIERGAFFRREIMCASLPPFPGDIDTATPLEGSADADTARQRLAPLLSRPDCAACHAGFNPIGLALEQYDAIGAYRTTENGAMIDPSGDIAVNDVIGTFAGPGELMDIVANAASVRDCYATHWFRFAHGRREAPEDACTLAGLHTQFADFDGDIRELMIAITQTEAFLFRPTVEVGTP
jgi:hypothetical protein